MSEPTSGTVDPTDQLSTHRFLTAPNLFTLLRLCCIPIFCWLLFGKDDQVAAAWLLGGLGATDWVDGWLARRFHQVSEFGKIFDPTADRLLFIVAIGSIIVAGIPPAFTYACLYAGSSGFPTRATNQIARAAPNSDHCVNPADSPVPAWISQSPAAASTAEASASSTSTAEASASTAASTVSRIWPTDQSMVSMTSP
mgnify:CR=1 FL=1